MEINSEFLLLLEQGNLIGEKERIDYRLKEIEIQFNDLLNRPHVRAALVELFTVNTISNTCTDIKKHNSRKNKKTSKGFFKIAKHCSKLQKYNDVKLAIRIVYQKTALESQRRDLITKMKLFNNEEFNNGKQL